MKIVLSWSGGKDSCLALHKLIESGHDVKCLVTTVIKDTDITFAHGDKIEMVQLQAEALQIPHYSIVAQMDHYTEDFIHTIKHLKEKYDLDALAYGDLYLDEHREWGESVAKQADLDAFYPLWMKKESSLLALEDFINHQYDSIVLRVQKDKLSEEWLGRNIDTDFYNDIQALPVCPMGESGEYHSFVYNGPLFKKGITFDIGNIVDLDTTKKMELTNLQIHEK